MFKQVCYNGSIKMFKQVEPGLEKTDSAGPNRDFSGEMPYHPERGKARNKNGG